MKMAGELTAVVQGLFEALDKGDADTILARIGSDAQGVDEIARRWLRGPGELTTYVRQLIGEVQGVHSEMSDVHESMWGDVGLVTCMLDQDYTYEGEPAHITAPTTAVMRREDGEWKIELFHSVPLEPAE
jgi:ketosteroid isomerase-like protein